MNLFHLITHFPRVFSNDMHEAISSLFTKCPQAAINLSKNKSSQECHDLLLTQSPPIVVHQAIKAGFDWEYLRPIVMATTDALTLEDEESGLVPFMLAAQKCNNEEDDDTSGSLSGVYELLCLQPDVLKDYDKSNMASKRALDENTNSNDDQGAKRCRLSA